ncbi:MAG TPA: carbonic anhydrase [Verrucomicrobiae bacterium]|nr:carbonic anhydrase [Verrucomicrobiae bacterium]
MRLLEVILSTNRSARGSSAIEPLELDKFKGSVPLVILSCIDPRLNQLLPRVIGLPELEFIWLRNAGNVVADSSSGAARSIALACAIKRGREIAIIGHTDCRVRATSVQNLLEGFNELGIVRSSLPENLVESFGLFASERQNVITGVDVLRRSALIGPRVPVHGLLLDVQSGKLECVVNGYDTLL